MSKEHLEQFMTQVADSEDLQGKIGEEVTGDALVALGAAAGDRGGGEGGCGGRWWHLVARGRGRGGRWEKYSFIQNVFFFRMPAAGAPKY